MFVDILRDAAVISLVTTMVLTIATLVGYGARILRELSSINNSIRATHANMQAVINLLGDICQNTTRRDER